MGYFLGNLVQNGKMGGKDTGVERRWRRLGVGLGKDGRNGEGIGNRRNRGGRQED
jgi:hypothetical protein